MRLRRKPLIRRAIARHLLPRETGSLGRAALKVRPPLLDPPPLSARLPPARRQPVEPGKARLGAERLLDAQRLVPFRHAF
jgi:hypothetical protein